jgi:hypothetical protein
VLATPDVEGFGALDADDRRLGNGIGTNGFPSDLNTSPGCSGAGTGAAGTGGTSDPGCAGPSLALSLATATLSLNTRKVCSISPGTQLT